MNLFSLLQTGGGHIVNEGRGRCAPVASDNWGEEKR